jgi:C-terminal peptidase prc
MDSVSPLRAPRRRRAARALLLLGLCLAAPGVSHLTAQTGAVPQAGLTADEWAARGRAAHDAGSTEEALDSFDHAVSVDPSRDDLRLEYAELLRQAAYWVRAADQYRKLLKDHPQDVRTVIGYGELLNAQYQFAAAAEHFGRALQMGVETHDRERVLVGLGSARFGMGDYAGAAQVFEGVLKESPRVMTAMAYLAIAKRNMGDLDGAEALWNRFLEIDPAASPAKTNRIMVQELKSAIETARRTVQEAPDNPDAWAALGRQLRRKPDLPGAEQAFAAAARLAPRNGAHPAARGLVLRDMGHWAEAADSFAAAAGDARWGGIALYNLAYVARRGGDAARETKAWSDAVKRNPGDLYAYRRYLAALRAHGGLDLEVSLARDAAAQDQGSAAPRMPRAVAYARLAMALDASASRDAARQAALDALRQDPNDVHAQRVARDILRLTPEELKRLTAPAPGGDAAAARLRGAVLMALGRGAEAEPELREAVRLAPEDPLSLTALAGCLRASGRRDEALALMTRAHTIDPGYVYPVLDAALTFTEEGRFAEAVTAARQAITLAPRNPVGYSLLGGALRQSGQLEEATQALEDAVALDPMDEMGAPRMLLAKVLGERGRFEEARDELKGDLPQEPDEMYRLAWEFVRDHYHDRRFNGQDWTSWRDRFAGKLKTPADALGAVALMLSSLDDRNTRLRSAEQTARLFFALRTDATEFSSTGVALGTSRTVESKRLEDNTGYIAITNFDDPSSHTEIRKAVEEMKTADGVILDLRGNPGGADTEVPRITSLFVEPGTQTGTTIKPEGKSQETVPSTTPDGKPVIPGNKPVVILVDRNTASSAETLAASLKEAGRAVLVGEKTYGKAGIQAPKLLPGGSVVLVITAEHADRAGEVYSGRGLQPDVSVDSKPGERGPDDAVLKKARDVLRKRRDG